MITKWNGLRAAAGAAALAFALVAGSPAQARLYSFTVTATDYDDSVYEGSGVIDTTQNQGGLGYAYYAFSNPTGFFRFQSHPPVNIYTYFSLGGDFLDISNDSDGQHSHAGGYIDFSQILTASALTTGNYNEFNNGTYDFKDYFFAHSDGESLFLSPVSMTLRIGPAAPAPLVGGGLLSALAALLALGMTRLSRRRQALA